MQAFAVEKRVGPVVVAVILVGLPGLRRPGGIVSATAVAGGFIGLGRGGREDGSAVRQVEGNIGREADGEADVCPGGKNQRAPTLGGDVGNSTVDGGSV